MTDGAIVVLTTAGSEEQAEQIASALVAESLAACVNVLPGIRSVYKWKGKIEKDREVLVLVKTTAGRFEAVRRRIRELHSYELPEAIALPVVDADPDVLAWLLSCVQP